MTSVGGGVPPPIVGQRGPPRRWPAPPTPGPRPSRSMYPHRRSGLKSRCDDVPRVGVRGLLMRVTRSSLVFLVVAFGIFVAAAIRLRQVTRPLPAGSATIQATPEVMRQSRALGLSH